MKYRYTVRIFNMLEELIFSWSFKHDGEYGEVMEYLHTIYPISPTDRVCLDRVIL